METIPEDKKILTKKEKRRLYYLKNREQILKNKNIYYHKNIDNRQVYNKLYHQQHKSSIKDQKRIYYEKNREKILENKRIYRLSLSDEIKKKNTERDRKRNTQKKIENPMYRIIKNMRRRILSAFEYQNLNKSKKSLELIGCTPDFLKTYISQKFKDGMNYTNNGLKGWHIDHIIPLSSAGNDIEKLEKLCHYTNLQPLWWFENLSKGDKFS
ncbi:MAG: HNH endonuclease signature motif containing protein [bacterium]